MNKCFQRALVVCLAVAASFYVSVRTASAQIMDGLKVNLPEHVVVGGVALPGGSCTIQDIGKDDGATVLLIRSNTGVNVAVIAEPIMPLQPSAEQTRVVLRREGNNYQLDKIWIEGQATGYHIVSVSGHE